MQLRDPVMEDSAVAFKEIFAATGIKQVNVAYKARMGVVDFDDDYLLQELEDCSEEIRLESLSRIKVLIRRILSHKYVNWNLGSGSEGTFFAGITCERIEIEIKHAQVVLMEETSSYRAEV